MEVVTVVLTGIFIPALYKAIETIWEQSIKAAWKPGSEAIKERFFRLAGKDQESQRRAAFSRAAEMAHTNTMRQAADPQQAAKILNVLNSKQDKRGAEALAEEAAKLLLFSAAPDVPRLTAACQRNLRFEALFSGEPVPSAESVATVLSDFLTNLREALLDQAPYHDLIEKDMRRTLQEILAELRPVPYDNEATYRAQLAEMHRQLEFVGIPELKERRPITVEDIFVRLRAERETQVLGVPEEILTDEVRRVLLETLRQLDSDQQKVILLRYINDLSTTEISRMMGKSDSAVKSLQHRALTELRKLMKLRSTAVKERVGVDEALRGTKYLVVLGDPGAGKTTLLKYLTVICAEGRAEAELGLRADGTGSPLPVFIPLREFAAECARRDQDYCLLDYLYTHAREHLMLNLQR
ncbi:MAG: hypothetical protein FJ026_18635, partial [Chloroflexi bacterium]|nr:hypothetical protein [Chloroflexota bacterium]